MASREAAFQDARDAAVLTHGHPTGYLAAAYFAAIVHDVSRGVAMEQAMGLAGDLLQQEPRHEETADILARVKALASQGPPSPEAVESLGGGWIAEEALAIAVLCALTVEGRSIAAFKRALWRSVAHGGDSDSTGSLTGNLLGAMFGASVLPKDWLEELELRDVMECVAIDLHEVFARDGRLPVDDYPPN